MLLNISSNITCEKGKRAYRCVFVWQLCIWWRSQVASVLHPNHRRSVVRLESRRQVAISPRHSAHQRKTVIPTHHLGRHFASYFTKQQLTRSPLAIYKHFRYKRRNKVRFGFSQDSTFRQLTCDRFEILTACLFFPTTAVSGALDEARTKRLHLSKYAAK